MSNTGPWKTLSANILPIVNVTVVVECGNEETSTHLTKISCRTGRIGDFVDARVVPSLRCDLSLDEGLARMSASFHSDGYYMSNTALRHYYRK